MASLIARGAVESAAQIARLARYQSIQYQDPSAVGGSRPSQLSYLRHTINSQAARLQRTTEGGRSMDDASTRHRRYLARRAARTAPPTEQSARRPWSIPDAKIAIDPSLTVVEAALQIGRTASAVESLRSRWRAGKLPAALAARLPAAPTRPAKGYHHVG